ncbi:MAG: hypothetical protein ACI9YH_004642 [Colwellia sp.]|jgi:hypothetical protein
MKNTKKMIAKKIVMNKVKCSMLNNISKETKVMLIDQILEDELYDLVCSIRLMKIGLKTNPDLHVFRDDYDWSEYGDEEEELAQAKKELDRESFKKLKELIKTRKESVDDLNLALMDLRLQGY